MNDIQKSKTAASAKANLSKIINWATDNQFHPHEVSYRTIEGLFRQSSLNNDSVLRSLSHFAWDMYHGNQLKYLQPNQVESNTEFLNRPGKGFLNITRLMVNILSSLYKKAPTRKFEASEKLKSRIEQIYDGGNIDNVMLTADRYAKLEGACAIRPLIHQGQLVFHIYPAHSFRVLTKAEKPWKPSVFASYHYVDNGSRGEKLRIVRIWTETHFVQLENNKLVKSVKHNLKRLPFVFIRDSHQPTCFAVQPQGAEIAFQNTRINTKLSDLAHTVKMQGFGVLEVVNPDPNQEVTIAPNRAIQFRVMDNEPYGINFKHPNAPITELIEDIKFDIEQLLLTYRIPESAVTVHLSNASSGVAIVAAQTPMHEMLQERASLFMSFEQDLFDCILRVLPHSDKSLTDSQRQEILSNKCEIRVDFPKPELNLSHSDKLADLEFKLKHNLITPWELMYQDNPNIFTDLNEAKDHYLSNLKQLNEAKNQNIDN